MTSNTAPTARPTTVTVPAGYRTRIMAQTASRDFDAVVVAGTYPLEYTSVQYGPVREGERPYYALARVEIECPARQESSAEFGGVALAMREVPATREAHTMVWYAYEVEDGEKGALRFA